MISKFIGGSNIIKLKYRLNQIPYKHIINFIGEKGNFYNENKVLASSFNNKYITLKLTSLDLPNENIAYDNALEISRIAIDNNNKILIDAEDHNINESISNIANSLIDIYNKDQINIYRTHQMYYKNSISYLENQLKLYPNSGIKLVRGAYLNQDSKYNVLENNIENTHYNFNTGIEIMSQFKKKQTIIASHNDDSCLKALDMKDIDFFDYAQLLGMNDSLSKRIQDEGGDVYKYIPYGPLNLCVPYLLRRLYENLDTLKYLNLFK